MNPTHNRLKENNRDGMSALVNCYVQHYPTKAFLDTGAQISLMSSSLYEKLTHKCELGDGIKLEGIVKDIKLDAKLCAGVEVSFNGNSVYTWKFYVAPITEPLIIGLDFLCQFGAALEFVTAEGNEFISGKVVLDKKVSIPPKTVINTHARLDGCLKGEVVITSSGFNRGALLPNLLVEAKESVPIQLVNDSEHTSVLKTGHVLGDAVECEVLMASGDLESHEVNVHSNLPEHLVGLFERSQKSLQPEQCQKLKSLLTEYQDIFSEGSHDLDRFTEISHTINTGDEKPINKPCDEHHWVLRKKKKKT